MPESALLFDLAFRTAKMIMYMKDAIALIPKSPVLVLASTEKTNQKSAHQNWHENIEIVSSQREPAVVVARCGVGRQ